ncbi:MAG: diacylglycerol/lipid kinase family protein, partial [Gaiellales bacterium]
EGVVAELSGSNRVSVIETRAAGHATAVVREHAPASDVVLALGGDGLFNEVVNGAPSDVPIGFLPGGASNVLSRALGLPSDPLRAAARIADSTRTRRITLGVANGRRFAFACGIGLDAEVVRAVDARGRAHGRRPGDHVFVTELAKLLWRRRRGGVTPIDLVGHGRVAMAVVANTSPYTYAGPLPIRVSPTATFEGGLDIVAPIDVGPRTVARLVWHLTLRPGTRARVPGVRYLLDTDRAELVADLAVPVQVDGEDIGDVRELVLEAERGAISVLV